MTSLEPKPEIAATLTARVRRQPPSLANYHYYLEPGKTVYIVDVINGVPLCASIKEDKHRISEDYFNVPYSKLSLIEKA